MDNRLVISMNDLLNLLYSRLNLLSSEVIIDADVLLKWVVEASTSLRPNYESLKSKLYHSLDGESPSVIDEIYASLLAISAKIIYTFHICNLYTVSDYIAPYEFLTTLGLDSIILVETKHSSL